jgi:hypothetical protein
MATTGKAYPTPNWDKWRLIPEPRLWQCVALSLNIDPDSIEIDPVFGRDPILPTRFREFRDRIDIAGENLHRTLRGTAVAMEPLQSRVSLRDFAAWVRQIGWDVSQELLAIGDQRPQNVNWDYWGTLDLWPLVSACKLICGDDPNEQPREGEIENPDPSTRGAWVNLFHTATAAIMAEKLNVKNGCVYPEDFIVWARGKGAQIPPQLIAMADDHDPRKQKAPTLGAGRAHNKAKTEGRNREWRERIKQLKAENPTASHVELCDMLKRQLGIKLDVQTIRRITGSCLES